MLPHEQARVEERGLIFKKRTSFEDTLILDHLKEMIKGVQSTDLKLNANLLPKNDHSFEPIRTTKYIENVSTNTYLTEDEKWQITNCILTNQ